MISREAMMPETAELPATIAFLAYEEGAYPDYLLETLVRGLQVEGCRIAGVLQHDLARRDRSRCDMNLEDLASGTLIALSEDRGAAARGCRIDQSGLARAAALIAASIASGNVDLLVVNKFGKIESEGGGLRGVIAEAVTRGIPVVIGVPMRNLDAWAAFACAFAEPVEPSAGSLRRWVSSRLRDGAHPAAAGPQEGELSSEATRSSVC
jgi:nucleoside-triphosphatase THEP1